MGLLSGPLPSPAPLVAQESAAAAERPASSEGRIEGRVTSTATGAALPGAAVRVEGSDRGVLTDARGYYTLRAVPAGTVTIEIQRLGHESARLEAQVEGGARTVVDAALAEQPIGMDPLVILSQRTRMVGDPLNLSAIPGSAHFLGPQDLEGRKLAFDNVHEVLRRIPGVNVQEEEGYGLRPNIGLRGTGVERSSKITLMEDGILIAPAPYAAPAAYYFPVVGRMEAVEVRKGSSQIRYGPRTIGGAINLVSASIPEETAWHLDTQGGSDRQFKVQARGGSSTDHVGWMVETYQLQTDGFKELPGNENTGFDVRDFTAKLRLNTDREAPRYQEIELKVGYHDELSHETYLGLTDEDFRTNPRQRYAASAEDLMDAEHRQIQLRHFIQPTPRFDVTSTAYRNEFARNWYKLGSVLGTSISNVLADPGAHSEALAILRGGASEEDALTLRANNREYLSQGIQSLVGLRLEGLGASHSFEAGIRLHEDSEDRLQWEDGYRMTGGLPVRTSEGAPGTQANRVGEANAVALHLMDEIGIGRWTIVPGVRYERIHLTRTDYSTEGASRLEPTRVRESTVSAFIPGVGASYEVSPSLHLFGGVHRGFAPPGPGAAEETRPEESVSYEVGSRLRSGGVGLQMAAFYGDYSNILGQATLATGGAGVGNQYNGGAARVAGLEASLDWDLSWGRDLPVRLPVSVAYTLTDATFRTDFESDFGPWGTVERGDRLPYLARHQGSASIGVEDADWSLSLVASGSSALRTRAGQGPAVESESTDSFLTFDVQGSYVLPQGLRGGSLYAGIQNLTDESYITARRPAGVRPGLPRTFYVGMRVSR